MTEFGMKRIAVRAVIALCAISVILAAGAWAQTTDTQVKSGEVVYVSGNDLVVKMDDGQVKTFNVPDDFKFNVDGKEISVHDLTPGTHLTQTITTTTTPRTVTTVKTVTGTVRQVNGPYVTLSLPDGTYKTYKPPKDTKWNIGGEEKMMTDLRPGMKVTATVVTSTPETIATRAATVSGRTPPPPPTPPSAGVILIEEAAAPEPAPAPVETAAATPPPEAAPQPPAMPRTGSPLPLIGLLGLLSASGACAARILRRRSG